MNVELGEREIQRQPNCHRLMEEDCKGHGGRSCLSMVVVIVKVVMGLFISRVGGGGNDNSCIKKGNEPCG